MKRYNEFLNELKVSTYFSAADKLENNSQKLSYRFIEHGNKIKLKEILDDFYQNNIKGWLTCAPKEDILAERDKNTIHPLLLELEEGGYLDGDAIFWNGAGMDKKTIGINWDNYWNDKNKIPLYIFDYDNTLMVDFGQGSGGNSYVLESLPENEQIFIVSYCKQNGHYNDASDCLYVKKLPRKLAKQLFNSSFFSKDVDTTWHVLWNEEN